MAGSTYQQLPGSGLRRGFAATAVRNTLWLGDDHLLSVDATMISETYKRFYFRDIQALIVQQSPRRGRWNLFLGAIILLTSWISLAAERNVLRGLWQAAILNCVFFTLLLVNTLRGPTCRCRLRTAVQEEELAALHRLRPARRAIDRIVERVTAVQGRPAPDQIAALTARSPSTPPEGRSMAPAAEGGFPASGVAPPPSVEPEAAPRAGA